MAEIVSIRRKTTTVAWSEVEPLLNQVLQATSSSMSDVLNSIGYDSTSSVGKWRTTGQVPLRVRLALVGLLYELRVAPKERQFTFDELTAIFGALSGWTVPEEARKSLIKKIVKELHDA